jgi:hypothetical protein
VSASGQFMRRCADRGERDAALLPSSALNLPVQCLSSFAALRLGRLEVCDLNVIERILPDHRVGAHVLGLILRGLCVRSLNRVVQRCRDVEACHGASFKAFLRSGWIETRRARYRYW